MLLQLGINLHRLQRCPGLRVLARKGRQEGLGRIVGFLIPGDCQVGPCLQAGEQGIPLGVRLLGVQGLPVPGKLCQGIRQGIPGLRKHTAGAKPLRRDEAAPVIQAARPV